MTPFPVPLNYTTQASDGFEKHNLETRLVLRHLQIHRRIGACFTERHRSNKSPARSVIRRRAAPLPDRQCSQQRAGVPRLHRVASGRFADDPEATLFLGSLITGSYSEPRSRSVQKHTICRAVQDWRGRNRRTSHSCKEFLPTSQVRAAKS